MSELYTPAQPEAPEKMSFIRRRDQSLGATVIGVAGTEVLVKARMPAPQEGASAAAILAHQRAQLHRSARLHDAAARAQEVFWMTTAEGAFH